MSERREMAVCGEFEEPVLCVRVEDPSKTGAHSARNAPQIYALHPLGVAEVGPRESTTAPAQPTERTSERR